MSELHKLCEAFDQFVDRGIRAGITTDAALLDWYEVGDREAFEAVVQTMLLKFIVHMQEHPQAHVICAIGSLLSASILFGAYAAREKLL